MPLYAVRQQSVTQVFLVKSKRKKKKKNLVLYKKNVIKVILFGTSLFILLENIPQPVMFVSFWSKHIKRAM